MVSSIFTTAPQRKQAPPTNTRNDAGGKAYKLSDEEALAQLALTGTFNDTFYARGEKQFDRLLQCALNCTPEFIAKTAVYARKHGLMKDMPVALLAILVTHNEHDIAKVIAPAILDNGKQIRNFVKMMRSGAFGRKSLGSCAKSIVQGRLNAMTAENLLWASVGNDPSIGDVIKLSHPKPALKWREAAYAYLIGKQGKEKNLPAEFKEFERWKESRHGMYPNLPIEAITPLLQDDDEWKQFAQTGHLTFLAVLKNLNSFARHHALCDRLLDIIRAGGKVMPYQIMTAIAMTENLPAIYQVTLEAALERSLAEVPAFGRVVIGVDTSGSMQDPITGTQAHGKTSKVKCQDVAALIAAALISRAETGLVVPFDTQVQRVQLGKSIMDNTRALATVGGGGTDCSIPLGCANQMNFKADLVVIISDNQSWVQQSHTTSNGTGMAQQWAIYKRNNPLAKLVCIDLTPGVTSQVQTAGSVLNVGGFSDHVFSVIADFAEGNKQALLDKIKKGA